VGGLETNAKAKKKNIEVCGFLNIQRHLRVLRNLKNQFSKIVL
jgi:hypothetical protein